MDEVDVIRAGRENGSFAEPGRGTRLATRVAPPTKDPETDHLGPALIAAVRALLSLVATLPPLGANGAGSNGSEQVVLSVVVDGFRCAVTRVSQQHELPHHLTLSPRESEIARLVALGLTNRTIANLLEISQWTVGTHLRRTFTKLGVSSRAAMVARLIELEQRSQ